MTVTNTSSKQAAQAMDGVATVFSFTLTALVDFPDAIKATVLDTTTDTETDLIKDDPGVDGYTVSIDADGLGGSITVISARTSDFTITIYREYDLLQESNFADYNSFPAETVETDYDLGTMIDQQLQEVQDRTIKLPITVTGVSTELPVPEANAAIGWDPTATFLVNNPTGLAQVAVDALATPDYLGATAGDGALRTSGILTYTDGGDFVTIGLTSGLVDHDATLNYSAAQHFTMLDEDDLVSDSDTQAATQQSIKAYVDAQIGATNEFTELTDTPATYTGQSLLLTRVNAGETAIEFFSQTLIDHDTLTNFVANEHIDHTAVDIATAAGTSGLAGGGDISATRNLVVDIANTTAGTVSSLDEVLIADVDDSDNLKRVTAQSIADLGAGGGAVEILDEAVSLTAAVSSIDFVGAGVTATNVGSAVTVTIPGGGGGATLDHDVNQTTHGFSVGEWVYHNGTIYALADASAAATAESIGVVSAVADGDNFTVQFGGRITGLSGLTTGEAHFLSETAGAITATAPSTEDSIVKPVLIADSTTTGFIFNMRGIAVTSTTSFYQSFVDADLTAGVLTVTHNLGHKYATVQLFNNSDKMIMPDDITLVDNDSLTVDLTSYGTLTGTWRVVVLDVGTTTAYTNTTFTQTFADGDLSAGVLTVTHSLSDQYPIIQVYDENDQLVVPDNITASGVGTALIDLSSFGTIAGTWRVVLSAIGGTDAASPTNTSFLQAFTDGSLTAGVLTIPHGLGAQYVTVQVYDNNDDMIQPDDVTLTDANNLDVDLTSYGTLTGTWNAVVISAGTSTSNIASDLNLSGQAAEDVPYFNGTNWEAAGGLEKIVVGTFTRNTADASGTQAVTGVGFRPSYIMLFGGQDNTSEMSWGFADATTGGGITDRQSISANTMGIMAGGTQCIVLLENGSDFYVGTLQSFDADGFTIDWTKTGTPTGTASMKYTAFR